MNENLICHHTICDWDDTLCPSSYLECKQAEGKPLDDKDLDQLQKFEEVVCLFLLKALEKDGVFIITNASCSWVEHCCKCYLPSVAPILKDIPIISARDAHCASCPNCDNKWKMKVFNAVIQAIQRDEREKELSLLSIGDSVYERDAFMEATKNDKRVIAKSVKFLPHPSLLQLTQELKVMTDYFDQCSADRNRMDLQLAIR